MKKIVQTMALLFLAVTGMTAEPVITLTTAKQYGETLKLSPVPTEAGTIQVDWGDGTKENYSTSLSHSYGSAGSHTVTIKLAGGTSLKIGNVAGITKVNLADF